MTNQERVEYADIFPFRGKMICHDCFNQLSEKARGGRVARARSWVPEPNPNAICSKCGKEGYYDDPDQN
jgi:hypothetical protein